MLYTYIVRLKPRRGVAAPLVEVDAPSPIVAGAVVQDFLTNGHDGKRLGLTWELEVEIKEAHEEVTS